MQQFSNFARTELVSAVSVSDTTINVLDGALLPLANVGAGELSAGDWFNLVIRGADGMEVIKVRGHDGNGQLTHVLRGQSGTTARAWDAGTIVGLRPLAEDFQSIWAKLGGIETGAQVNAPTNLSSSATGTQLTLGSSTGLGVSLDGASTVAAGIMTAADKTKLDGIETGAEKNKALAHATLQSADKVTLVIQYGAEYFPAEIGVATNAGAGLMSTDDRVKLDGIAAEATANLPDATLLNRASHNGVQAISTVDGLQSALDAKAAATNGTLTRPTIAASREAATPLSSGVISLNDSNYFSHVVSANVTFSVTNVLTSSTTAQVFLLELHNGGSKTVTWWSGIKWAGGTAPVLTASGIDLLGFIKRDSYWYGFLLGKDMK